MPDCLEVTARTEDGCIMGVRHKTLPIAAVQVLCVCEVKRERERERERERVCVGERELLTLVGM